MAMNKKEKASMDRLRRDLYLARAMRWPSYPMPEPMSDEEIKASLVDGGVQYGHTQRVARGWFSHAYIGSSNQRGATYGCSNGMHHSTNGDVTTTQTGGRMFATKRQALEALRIELTEQCAEILAGVDAQLFECDD